MSVYRAIVACAGFLTLFMPIILTGNIQGDEPGPDKVPDGPHTVAESLVTWRLEEHPTAKNLADGKGLVFEGDSAVGICAPRHDDFRLEQLRPLLRRVPLVFGHSDEIIPPDGAMKRVRLHLHTACPEHKCQPGPRSHAYVSLNARGLLHANADYRLTWTCRPFGKSDPVARQCDFHIDVAGQGLPDGGDPGTELPEHHYRVEILYRRREEVGVLFLAQKVIPSPVKQCGEIAAIGFSAEGNSVAPPDPGYERIRSITNTALRAGWKARPPLALRTHTHGAMYEQVSGGRGRISVRVSDVATGVSLSTEREKPTYVVFSDALFRIQLLTANLEHLRQDRAHWKQRIQTIALEVVSDADVDPRVRQWVEDNVRKPAVVVGNRE
jgi:hypothetical protein